MKLLKNFAGLLKRNEGFSIVAVIALMVIMAVMGGVFSSIMGRWKLSSPSVINSSKAFYLAETAAMFALQEAQYTFYGGNFNYGTNDTPQVVATSTTEEANYWFERPGPGYENDDDDSSSASSDDDDENDDADDSDLTLYTIIATGKVIRNNTTVAKRQIKIKATIIKSPTTNIDPGVHTEGGIIGGGGPNGEHLDIDNPTTGANVTYGNGTNNDTSGSESGPPGIVYRDPPDLERDMFKALSTSQGHNQSGTWTAPDDYPTDKISYYYDTPTNTPNITYVDGNLRNTGSSVIYGVFWVTGWVTISGNSSVHGIIICEGDITLNGGAGEFNGGIIQYGAGNELTGNGVNADITVNTGFFEALSASMPIITVQSCKEAVSAN